MHRNILTLTTNKMNTPSHLHTNSWLLLLPKTSQPEYLGWGNPVLRGTQEKSFPVQYMHQGPMGWGPRRMAPWHHRHEEQKPWCNGKNALEPGSNLHT